MRGVLLVVILAAAAPAHASSDHESVVTYVAPWADADAIVVERHSYSQAADGEDLETWWTIEAPAGVVQATIHAPYTKKAKLVRAKKATIDQAKLDGLLARLREVVGKHKRLNSRTAWAKVAGELGLVALKREKKCGARVKVGKKRLMLWAGTNSKDLGRSTVETSCGPELFSVEGRSGYEDSMKPQCYEHAGGWIVQYRLHHGCEGDYYYDDVAWIEKPAP